MTKIKTIKIHENRFLVQVSPSVAKKVLSVDSALAQLGVEVYKAQVAKKAVKDAVDFVRTAWLVYSIVKEAKNKWPAIKEILVNAGLSNEEIITLNLSQHLNKKVSKKKKNSKRKE